MLMLVTAILLAGGPVPPTIGEVFYGHAMGNSDPIPDMTLRPARLPDCRTGADIQKALADKARHREPTCLLPMRLPAAETRAPR